MNKFKEFVQNCVVILGFITVVSYMGGLWWGFDLLAHGRVQYAICGVVGLVTLLVITVVQKTSWQLKHLAIAVVVMCANMCPVLAFYIDDFSASSAAQDNSIRVMSLNVHTSNNHYQKVIDAINAEAPDVLLLVEVNNRWLKNIAVIEGDYPYKIAQARPDNFGIVLYSKRPLINPKLHEWGGYRVSYITATVNDEYGNNIDIVGLHTIPPMSGFDAQDNHNQTAHVMNILPDANVVLMGDFNNTPWSGSYKKLMHNNRLRNAGAGNVPTGSWLKLFMGGLMIDHIFVQNLSAKNWHIGQDVGSDHRAVVADVFVSGGNDGK